MFGLSHEFAEQLKWLKANAARSPVNGASQDKPAVNGGPKTACGGKAP